MDMSENLWTRKYTVLDKTREQLIKDLEIQAAYYPYIDAAKQRIQDTGKYGPVHDAADLFLQYLEEECKSIENEAN
ncbi:hypothetical protein [Bacillus sp. V2I10]|uniref:hypothetical protein n=1 Tax=Bacillus sp. V2I10 TaxID=3042276 RepID=UPI00277E2F68|nr:hypothetical protein [Bacillus sp. V2I10]MDQ0859115.1 hypothetical protein [Bacillus sp. V2I10]